MAAATTTTARRRTGANTKAWWPDDLGRPLVRHVAVGHDTPRVGSTCWEGDCMLGKLPDLGCGGQGHVRCDCGEESPHLSSVHARRAWLRAHRLALGLSAGPRS